MKDKLFQIFFCIFIFWNTILSTYLGIRGGEMEGGLMRLTLVGLAAVSWVFFFLYPRRKEDFKIIFYLVIFGILLYSTRFFYPNPNHEFFNLYNGEFLRWGADSVTACVIGLTFSKQKTFDYIHKILPWECLALTPFLAVTTLFYASLQGQYDLDSGFNYQTIAYALAVLFSFSFFYTFIFKQNSGNKKIIRIIMLAAMLIQAVCCAMSGGRGGFVLLVVYIVYLAYLMLKYHIVSKTKLIGFLIISAIGFFIVANYLGLFDSAGFLRSSQGVKDNDRFELWAEYLPYIVQSPLIGHGLGGDYFTWGFYSHNIFVDWLVEVGFLGFIILSVVFYKTYKKLLQLTKYNQIFIVILILFVYGVIMNMFSGYWISTNTHWLVFGIVAKYEYPCQRKLYTGI